MLAHKPRGDGQVNACQKHMGGEGNVLGPLQLWVGMLLQIQPDFLVEIWSHDPICL